MSVTNNNSSYRRGVLLGLTMAEIIILIVFLLLLAFAALLDKEKKANAARESLFSNKDVIERIVRVFSTQPPDMEEDVVRAIESLPSIVSLIKEKDLARQEETLQDTLVRAVEKLEIEKNLSEGNSDIPIEQQLLIAQEKIKELEDDTKNLTDQKKSLISQIESNGRGVDMPPCWPDANGRATEYLFNIDLTNAGITMFDAAPAYRQEAKARLPLDRIQYGQPRSIAQFQTETQPIFEWSKQKECRFYVFVRDKTGATEKALFKRLLIAVEGPFYKKLSNVVATQEPKKSSKTKNIVEQEAKPESEGSGTTLFESIFGSSKNKKRGDFN